MTITAQDPRPPIGDPPIGDPAPDDEDDDEEEDDDEAATADERPVSAFGSRAGRARSVRECTRSILIMHHRD